jgi:hypothetical protein
MSKRGFCALPDRQRLALVGSGEYAFFVCWLSTMNALSGPTGLIERNTAHRGLRFFFDLGFAFRAAAPPCKREAGFDSFLEFAIVGWFDGMRFAKLESPVVQ